jgi:uroporphyrinogen decarboxylase
MKPVERVEAVMRGEKPDRTPVMHISFSSRIASHILGREAYVGGGIQQHREAVALWHGPDAHAEYLTRCEEDAVAIARACGHDCIRPYYWRMNVMPVERIDEFTFRYEHADGSWDIRRFDPPTELYNVVEQSAREEVKLEDVGRVVENAEREADKYEPSEARFADVLRVVEEFGDEFAVRSGGPWTCIPYEDPGWLEAIALAPDLVGRFLDTQVITSIKNIDFLVERGVKLFFGGGDMAYDLGPIYSPKTFQELMVPRLRKISNRCHALGVWHLFGTDGNLWPVADDFYGTSGIDGHYEVDRKAGMDILKVHERFPHITLFGNISSYTVHVGTVDDVIAETRACMEEAKATGKVVAGISNMIVPETPMANVEAMLETVDRYK